MRFFVDLFLWFFRRQSLKTVRSWGKRLGRIGYYLARSRRRTTWENLHYAYGDSLSLEEKKRIAKGCFENLLITSLEFLYSPSLGGDFPSYVQIVNLDSLRESYSQGKGVLVIVPHMGNWEVSGRVYPWAGIVAHVVTRKQRPQWVADLVNEIRAANGVHEIDKLNALRPVMTALKRGEVVNLLIDQHARKDAVLTTFFGKPAMTVGSAALIAIRTGCAVILGVSHRQPDGGIALETSPIIETVVTGDLAYDLAINTQRYVDHIEQYVRAHPDCWMWMHRRWRM